MFLRLMLAPPIVPVAAILNHFGIEHRCSNDAEFGDIMAEGEVVPMMRGEEVIALSVVPKRDPKITSLFGRRPSSPS